MKKLLVLLAMLVVMLVVTEAASAGPRRCGNNAPVYRGGGRNFGFRYSSGVRPNYWGPNWDYQRRYRSYYYSSGYIAQPTVVVRTEKPRPAIKLAKWDDESLVEFALNKFSFARGIDRDGNKVIMVIVAKDFHGDTGALKKVKFKVRWVEIVTKKVKDKDGNEVEVREEKAKDTTVKLKFDEFGRFTSYDD